MIWRHDALLFIYIISIYIFVPLLDGIDVPEEQQELPGAVLLSVREQEVVSGHAQRPCPRCPGSHSEHHVLHVSRLNMLRKLHFRSSQTRTKAPGFTKVPQDTLTTKRLPLLKPFQRRDDWIGSFRTTLKRVNRKNRVATANYEVRNLRFYSYFNWIILHFPNCVNEHQNLWWNRWIESRDNESAIQFVLKSRVCKNESKRIARC